MPGFDGTGPRGQGPMTGGRRGYCDTSRQDTDKLETERPRGIRFRDLFGFGRKMFGNRGGGRGRGGRRRFWKRYND